jgi:hypothetical protein
VNDYALIDTLANDSDDEEGRVILVTQILNGKTCQIIGERQNFSLMDMGH